MQGEYPGKPVKGWMEKKDMSQTWTGWKVYANPGPGRKPVMIVPGHDKREAARRQRDELRERQREAKQDVIAALKQLGEAHSARKWLNTACDRLTDRPEDPDEPVSREGPYEHLSDDAVGRGIQHQYNEGDAIGSVTELALEAARRLRKDEGGEKGE